MSATVEPIDGSRRLRLGEIRSPVPDPGLPLEMVFDGGDVEQLLNFLLVHILGGIIARQAIGLNGRAEAEFVLLHVDADGGIRQRIAEGVGDGDMQIGLAERVDLGRGHGAPGCVRLGARVGGGGSAEELTLT